MIRIKKEKWQKIKNTAWEMGKLETGCRSQAKKRAATKLELIYRHKLPKEIDKLEKGKNYNLICSQTENLGYSHTYGDYHTIYIDLIVENITRETDASYFYKPNRLDKELKVLKNKIVAVVVD